MILRELEVKMKKYDVVVVGSGFAGATIAERFANDGKTVLIIEKREHIGGNMYDYVDENGVITHKYGPHLFHTNLDNVYEYLTKFGEFFKYADSSFHNILTDLGNFLNMNIGF